MKGGFIISKAIFLDLQGTLGGEGLGDISDFSFYTFSYPAIKIINKSKFLAVIITNQSHIGKGYLTYEEYENQVEMLENELEKRDLYWDGIYCCPHTGEHGCICKKPKPGMLYQAQKDLNINLENSFVIGDMGASDMKVADKVGAWKVLVLTGVGKGSLGEYRNCWQGIEPDFIAENVLEGVKWILNRDY